VSPTALHVPLSGSYTRPATESRQVRRTRLMPFDVFLCQGYQSVRVFTKGPFDEFTFFQRGGIGSQHDVEYLTRLSPQNDGKERYTAYGMIPLADAQPLPELSQLRPFWRILKLKLGLDRLPPARVFLRQPNAWTPGADAAQGINRIRAGKSSGVFHQRGRRIVHYYQVLDLLRHELHGAERVAWIETAFHQAPETVTHRYYLDSDLGVFLVRHHPSEGKQLFQATLSEVRGQGLLIYVRRKAAS